VARRLDRLSAEQQALIPVVKEEWLRVGLATGAADRDAAWQGARAAFEVAGLNPPSIQVWLRSPLEGMVGAHILGLGWRPVADRVEGEVWGRVKAPALVWDHVWDQVWTQIREQVGGRVWPRVGRRAWAQVGDRVGPQVREQVGDQVREQVGDHVGGQFRGGAQVWAQVWDQVGHRVWDQVGDQVWAQELSRAVWGQHDAGRLSFFDFFGRCGIDGPERLRGLSTVARSCGWWWPFSGRLDGLVIFTERPIELHRDDEGGLHHDSRPAVLYPDGFGVWAWHGVRVPAQVIEAPQALAADRVIKEHNVELRRVMMQRYGHRRLLHDAGAALLDESEWGKLWRLEVEDDEPLVMVEVVNATPEPDGSFRDYFLRVNPGCRSALDAVAWTFNQLPARYRRSMCIET